MAYKNKYLKYKLKYLTSKNKILGGMREEEEREKEAREKAWEKMLDAAVKKQDVWNAASLASQYTAEEVAKLNTEKENPKAEEAKAVRKNEQIFAIGSISAVVLAAGVAVGCIIFNK